MRVYVPVTLPVLARAHASGRVEPLAGCPAHAVTPALREWYTEGDAEELEYAALLDAARTSLRALAADDQAPRRRVVLAVEVPDAGVSPDNSGAPSAVVLRGSVPMSAVVSIHLDEAEAEDAVDAAVRALPAADEGDEDAAFTVDGADGYDLLWYDVTEVPDLISPPPPPLS